MRGHLNDRVIRVGRTAGHFSVFFFHRGAIVEGASRGTAIEGRRPRRLSERESGVTRPRRRVHQSAIISESGQNADDDSQKLDEVHAASAARIPHPFVCEAPPTARSPLVRDSQPLTDVSGKAAR